MNLCIENKKVLITGGSRGIGRAAAEALAKEGCHVAVVARTKKEIDEFARTNEHHKAFVYDLFEEGMPEKMYLDVKENFGIPDIVIHNIGGTLDITDPLCSMDNWRKVSRFNLEIPVELNTLIIPDMQKKQWGRIVHISSIASLENQGPVTYCTAKAGLTAYVRSMGRIYSKDGISMSSVLPGAIFTEGGYWDTTSQTNPEHVEKYLKERMAIQRFGTLDEISNIITFLCSEHAGFVVGSAFTVDGGQGRCFFQPES
jgi:3-oxoacyl-[acyl-carrier protein] reductase